MTSLDALDILYTHLNGTLLQAANKPNGVLRRFQRPLNSTAEDVILNALPMNRDQLQRAVLNVNIYVKNLALSGDNTQPDGRRLKELATLANQCITEQWGTGYQFNVQQDNVFEDANNQHYINLRVEFRAINL
jgi:hypothetical protein